MRSSVEIVAKKAALYGTHSYFLTPYRATRYLLDDNPDSTGMAATRFTFDEEFVQFVEPLLPYVADGCMNVFPSWDVDGVKSAVDHSSYTTGYKGLLKIELEKRYLLEQLTESPAAVRLLLPHLSGVSANDLLEIRHEYESSLGEFQRSLYGLTSSDPAQGDRVLYELMQEVDQNIRRLNEKMGRLRKKRWFERSKLTLVAFPLVLAVGLPPELQDIVRAASATLGSAGLVSYVEGLRASRETAQDAERDPFYVPWLIESQRENEWANQP